MICEKCDLNMPIKIEDFVNFHWCWKCGNRKYTLYNKRTIQSRLCKHCFQPTDAVVRLNMKGGDICRKCRQRELDKKKKLRKTETYIINKERNKQC